MGQPTSLPCGAVCGGEFREETVLLAWLLPCFQSLLPLPTSILGPSGVDSWVSGFVYDLGPFGPLQQTFSWDWEFLPLLQPWLVFTARGFEALLPCAWTLGCVVCLVPQLFLSVSPLVNVGLPGLQATALLHVFIGCLPPPLLLVWVNVSFLTPWWLDFHTFWFSGSLVVFCF